ncbi:MAG: hypothetical protein K8T25_16120 [Planctomycetia bacterium]|nr:hypothetical protein [Planctomycetia bacterium]
MDEWRKQICNIFPDWGTAAALERWRINKPRLFINQQVRGKIIARAPFGVWLDIGVGHPALLLVTRMAYPTGQAIKPENLPPIGVEMNCHIAEIGDQCEIGLSQCAD